ncbi:phosphotransferase enzyme family protein [Streptomyces sp. NPDC059718]
MAFTEELARAVLAADGQDGAKLIALGENAVFELADGVTVAKVGRGPELLDRAAREVRTASWLAAHGVPAVRAAAPEARLVEGHPVTYWERLPDTVRPAGPADLAALLRLVHALPEPDFALPRRDLLDGVERWLRLAGPAVDPADAAYLRERRDGFAAAAAALTPHLPPGPIHGDALPRNVHVGPDGPVLVDLETFSADLREHDLVVMALSRDRYGLGTDSYDAFTAAYGWDVREWDGCAVLRGARETASCAWVAQHAPGNPAALAEFRRRVASLRDGDPAVRWYPF